MRVDADEAEGAGIVDATDALPEPRPAEPVTAAGQDLRGHQLARLDGGAGVGVEDERVPDPAVRRDQAPLPADDVADADDLPRLRLQAAHRFGVVEAGPDRRQTRQDAFADARRAAPAAARHDPDSRRQRRRRPARRAREHLAVAIDLADLEDGHRGKPRLRLEASPPVSRDRALLGELPQQRLEARPRRALEAEGTGDLALVDVPALLLDVAQKAVACRVAEARASASPTPYSAAAFGALPLVEAARVLRLRGARRDPRPLAALARSNATAASSVSASGSEPAGRVALIPPCVTYGP